MGRPYRTSDAERLLGVGEHVLRHWEKALPFYSPVRSAFGQREFSIADFTLLFRVKHLVREKGLNLAQVVDRLLLERGGGGNEKIALIQEARAALIESFFTSTEAFSKLEEVLKKDNQKTIKEEL